MAEYDLVKIEDLVAVYNPTTGHYIETQKAGSTSNRLALSSLMSAEGEGGVFHYFQKIGTWNMQSSPRKTITLSNPSTILGIRPGWINGDDSKQYSFGGIYDPYFYQNFHYTGYARVSGVATNTSSTSTAVTGSAGIGRKLIGYFFINESGQGTYNELGNSPEFSLGSVTDVGDNVRRVSYTSTIVPRFEIQQYSTSVNPTAASMISYGLNYIDILFQQTNNDSFKPAVEVKVYSQYSQDTHTHAISDHTHNIPSINSEGWASGGYNCKGINAFFEWEIGSSTLYLTHNYTNDVGAGIDTAFGQPASRNATGILENFKGTSANRGYIEIIRKFDL
jgi:hypothetical protein